MIIDDDQHHRSYNLFTYSEEKAPTVEVKKKKKETT